MNQPLVVKEFDNIVSNESLSSRQGYVYLEEKYFSELKQFIKEYVADSDEADILEFMQIGYKRGIGDTVTFKSFVGIIELASGFQIEILPKVALGEDKDNRKTKTIFLRMLNCLKDMEGKVFSSASLNVDRMNLYEIFIRMYIRETWTLVKRGIKSNYISNEDNLTIYKGKLDVSKHITRNTAHKERFYMVFDEYQVNRPENRLIKSTLLKLLSISRNPDNTRELKQLLYSFELVQESDNYAKDFSNVSLSRGMREYELLIQWAKVFLLNKSFTTFSGKKSGKALLFPMEQVFEAFIAKQVKTVFGRLSDGQARTTAQDHRYYLFDAPKKFKLRPDLVVRNSSDDNHPLVIMDTKWKKLSRDASKNYGISQADMYQMYAYAKKYNCSEIWLIYPMSSEVKDMQQISFKAKEIDSNTVSVRVFFVDLEHYKESIEELYRLVYIDRMDEVI